MQSKSSFKLETRCAATRFYLYLSCCYEAERGIEVTVIRTNHSLMAGRPPPVRRETLDLAMLDLLLVILPHTRSVSQYSAHNVSDITVGARCCTSACKTIWPSSQDRTGVVRNGQIGPEWPLCTNHVHTFEPEAQMLLVGCGFRTSSQQVPLRQCLMCILYLTEYSICPHASLGTNSNALH